MAKERWGPDKWGRRHAPHPMWKPDRNADVVAFIQAGGRICEAARTFGVSWTRVKQILRSAKKYDAA